AASVDPFREVADQAVCLDARGDAGTRGPTWKFVDNTAGVREPAVCDGRTDQGELAVRRPDVAVPGHGRREAFCPLPFPPKRKRRCTEPDQIPLERGSPRPAGRVGGLAEQWSRGGSFGFGVRRKRKPGAGKAQSPHVVVGGRGEVTKQFIDQRRDHVSVSEL